MALQAEAIAFDLHFAGVRVMAIGAAYPRCIHLALGKRAIFVDFAINLAIGVVEIPAQGRRQALVQLWMPRHLTDAKGLPTAVAKCALFDQPLAAERFVIHRQPCFGCRGIGFFSGFCRFRPIHMRLTRPMAALATDILFLPGTGKAVFAVVVVFHQPR
ncbi:hypothetical protein D3C72_1549210 [compost metagenome]